MTTTRWSHASTSLTLSSLPHQQQARHLRRAHYARGKDTLDTEGASCQTRALLNSRPPYLRQHWGPLLPFVTDTPKLKHVSALHLVHATYNVCMTKYRVPAVALPFKIKIKTSLTQCTKTLGWFMASCSSVLALLNTAHHVGHRQQQHLFFNTQKHPNCTS